MTDDCPLLTEVLFILRAAQSQWECGTEICFCLPKILVAIEIGKFVEHY